MREICKSLRKKGKVCKKIRNTTLQQRPVLKKITKHHQNPWQHWWWCYFEIYVPNCVL